MKNLKLLSALLLLFVVFVATKCKETPVKDKNTFNLNCQLKAGGKSLSFDSTYTLPNGQRYKATLLRYYLSNLRLVNTVGVEVKLYDVLLIEHTPGSSGFDVNTVGTNFTKGDLKDGRYAKIKFGVGVDKTTNATDANSYKNDHALSTYRGTFWTGMGGYRFIMCEGECTDSVGATTLNSAYLYHTGFDSFYTEVELPLAFSLASQTHKTATLTLDLNAVLNTMNFATENVIHNGDAVARKFTNAFVKSIKIE
ncbi:MAG: hypothetical protein NTX03_08830 [Bacteroidetes bacterium]|nr:hypothetical protein [Bacteroidota bacterium]